ncbi:MAG: hypothetical protein R8P61_31265 [Bacteroidia bacterium]|nr:hypothetical protein [Bacteroidia bacterium]
MKQHLFPPLLEFMNDRAKEFDQISAERKVLLGQLSTYLSTKYQKAETPKLIVICTHNSRRSHMGQIWLSVAAEYLTLPHLESYSGGTEATAFNHRSVAALQKSGLEIRTENADSKNPVYQLSWKADMDAYRAFSKKFSDPPNPEQAFAAIMVCTEADEACPFVPGAEFRLALPFVDPKAFDDTDLEAEKYEERSRQIAREILFALKEAS